MSEVLIREAVGPGACRVLNSAASCLRGRLMVNMIRIVKRDVYRYGERRIPR